MRSHFLHLFEYFNQSLGTFRHRCRLLRDVLKTGHTAKRDGDAISLFATAAVITTDEQARSKATSVDLSNYLFKRFTAVAHIDKAQLIAVYM